MPSRCADLGRTLSGSAKTVQRIANPFTPNVWWSDNEPDRIHLDIADNRMTEADGTRPGRTSKPGADAKVCTMCSAFVEDLDKHMQALHP